LASLRIELFEIRLRRRRLITARPAGGLSEHDPQGGLAERVGYFPAIASVLELRDFPALPSFGYMHQQLSDCAISRTKLVKSNDRLIES